ncbi:hypothetical protein [Streptosporangium sp. NPDC087985]|uniref:hypothetical protein n=1 Tax=Streptosporangium sp. NPDC087985 TaxID=3366196 RepID=UPI00382DB10A
MTSSGSRTKGRRRCAPSPGPAPAGARRACGLGAGPGARAGLRAVAAPAPRRTQPTRHIWWRATAKEHFGHQPNRYTAPAGPFG